MLQKAVNFLKFFETEKNGQRVHELRRSFEAGRKQDRVYPQLEKIYTALKDTPAEDVYDEFNKAGFTITLGLKSVTLVCTKPGLYDNLLWVFSMFDTKFVKEPVVHSAGPLMLSRKKCKMASRVLSGMTSDKVATMVSKSGVSQEEIAESTADTPEQQALLDALKTKMGK